MITGSRYLSIIQQYRESLKTVEAEEIFDLLIYRPLAFIFVKITYPLNFLTPNLVSVLAMAAGVAAGAAFGFGSAEYLLYGAALYFVSNILDCADGQIARLKKNGTKIGRIVDGFIDYVVSVSVFIGIGVGLSHQVDVHGVTLWSDGLNLNPYAYIWIATVLAGFSSALQAFIFDFYRNKFLEVVYGKFSPLEDEIKDYKAELERIELEPDKAGFMDSFLISLYLKYTALQMMIHNGKSAEDAGPKLNPKLYYVQNRLLLRMWSYVGSTTHITLCIVCALVNNMELFLLICILPLNLLMVVLYLVQSKVNTKLT